MRATPISLTVARQFLTAEAADAWDPEQQIITYAEPGTASGEESVQLLFSDINVYDNRGAWPRRQAQRLLETGLVQEDGEWRIDSVPDALIVPESWFDDWYERASLYYFDPTSEVLVAEPVFVPRGDQSASSLVPVSSRAPGGAAGRRPHRLPGRHPHGLSVPVGRGRRGGAVRGPRCDRRGDGQADARAARRGPSVRTRGSAPSSSASAADVHAPRGLGAGVPRRRAAYDPNGDRPVTDLFALQDGPS